ncbi:MAG: YdcF family protein [Anaerolineaceae bacterium]|nr:YdcF family protein [Anaerolineaceae bacterium]
MADQESQRSKSLTWRKPGWCSCLFGFLAGLALLYLLLRGAGAFLITGDPLERGDAVVVLGGGGEQRVVEAVRLVQERYGLWLIVTEPGEVVPGEGPGSEVFRWVAILEGISPDVILITTKTARNTYEEAEAVLDTMRKHKLNSIIVVTDPFHTQRTRLIFKSVFTGSGLTVRIHPIPGHWYRSTTWFLSLEGWGNTLREYVKLFSFFTGIYKAFE